MDRVTQEKLNKERAQRGIVEKEDQDFRHRMIKRQEMERAEEQKTSLLMPAKSRSRRVASLLKNRRKNGRTILWPRRNKRTCSMMRRVSMSKTTRRSKSLSESETRFRIA
jgi:hypothetical protein